MTISRKGLRRIRVDDHDYVWRVIAGPCFQDRSVVIADASREGSTVLFPGPIKGYPSTPVTPGLIAARIREARRRGWQPGEGRGVFVRLEGAD